MKIRILKSVIGILFFINLGCKNPSKQPTVSNLTAEEKQQIEKFQFDEILCSELKDATSRTFRVMQVENQSGKEIPKQFLPKMIYFKLEKSFDFEKIETIKTKYKDKGYNIYNIDQQDDSITLIVSKL